MKLLLFWIKEMKDVRKRTVIGLRSYLKHKLRISFDDRCFYSEVLIHIGMIITFGNKIKTM